MRRQSAIHGESDVLDERWSFWSFCNSLFSRTTTNARVPLLRDFPYTSRAKTTKTFTRSSPEYGRSEEKMSKSWEDSYIYNVFSGSKLFDVGAKLFDIRFYWDITYLSRGVFEQRNRVLRPNLDCKDLGEKTTSTG